MVNQVYQLIAPGQIGIHFEDISLNSNDVIVRPEYLSICAADQRYFTGRRDKATLKRKLPMALIHEAWGTVVYDAKGEFKNGEKVLLIPNTPFENNDYIAENYLRSSKFRASGFDGFMQEYVSMRRDRVIPFDAIAPEVAAICELISVAMHTVTTFMKVSHEKRDHIAVWGDGNVGYIVSLLIKTIMPKTKLTVLGIDREKLGFFSFADEALHVDEIPSNFSFDHAFECVGGGGSEPSIDQIIDYINPEGTIMLMGVSENNVPIKTRMVLEKGLMFLGRSRSGRDDFIAVANLLMQNPDIQKRLKKIIREVVPVHNISEMTKAFEEDIHLPFKTVMKWEV